MTVVLSSGSRQSVVVMDSPMLTVDPDGGLEVTYLSNEDATVTAGHFARGVWREAWYQLNVTVPREQYRRAAD